MSNRCHTVAGTFDDDAIHHPSDTGTEMFGGNVFYQSSGVGHCMHYQVRSRSKHNLTSPLSITAVNNFDSALDSYEDHSIPDLLASLTSRARIPEIQIAAARCLTYIHRSGSLVSTDPRIVYKTLPCLARLCTEEFDEDIRATSAETLAYLAEVSQSMIRFIECVVSNKISKFFSDRLGVATFGRHKQSIDHIVKWFIALFGCSAASRCISVLCIVGRQ